MADKQYEDMINGVIGQVDRVADKIIEIKTKYEPKSYDYSSVASTMKIVAVDGGQQVVITPPAGVDAVPIGAYTKIIITPPGAPQETPGDDDQVTLNGSLLWINKVNTDIMQWKEIKDNVANGDIMIIERIADSGGFKNYQLVKWEVKPSAGGSSGRWETIDIATFKWTKQERLRITYNNGYVAVVETNFNGTGVNFALPTVVLPSFTGGSGSMIVYTTWNTGNSPINTLQETTIDNGVSTHESKAINKVERWVE